MKVIVLDIIEITRDYVSEVLSDEPSSHDMGHVERVESLCMHIGEKEGGNPDVLRLASLLHDVGVVREHKEGGDHALHGAEIAGSFLVDKEVDEKTIEHVVSCIRTHRFSHGMVPESLEGQILQDADRIDALGAVGIFRSLLSMGALRGLKHASGMVKESSMNAYTQNPFEGFEEYMERKPFKIMDSLNTCTSRDIATDRLKIMEDFLEQLKREVY